MVIKDNLLTYLLTYPGLDFILSPNGLKTSK